MSLVMTTRLRERLELGPLAAASARRRLASLEGQLSAQRLQDLRVLVSELVTNSYRHAGLGSHDEALLTVDVDDRRVRVQVEDPGVGFDARNVRDRSALRESGWGLTIVDRLSDRWGVIEGGTTLVWFEVDLPVQPVSAAVSTKKDTVMPRSELRLI